MTDKCIACAILNDRLRNIIAGNDEIREITGQNISDARCAAIRNRVGEMCEKMRGPLVKYLNNSGADTI